MDQYTKIKRILIQIERNSNEDMILFALGFYTSLKREEFLTENEKLKRINKNTFHKYAEILKKKDWIGSRKEGKKSVYYINPLGREELSRKLKSYNLDFESILFLEDKKIQSSLISIKEFFKKYYIINEDLKIEFMDLLKEITYDKLGNIFTESKFYKLLLFLVFNHPRFYPEYSISAEDFREKFNFETDEVLTDADIKIFTQKVISEDFFSTKFFKIEIENNHKNLFFRKNSEYGRIVEATIESNYRNLYYLKNLDDLILNEYNVNKVDKKILSILVEKYKLFHVDLKNAITSLLEEYRRLVKDEQIKNLTYLTNLNSYYSSYIVDIPKQEDFSIDFIEDFKFFDESKISLEDDSTITKAKDKALETIISLYRKKEFLEALELIEKALPQNSANPDYYNWKTNILLKIDPDVSLESSQDHIDIILSNPLNEALKTIDLFFKFCEKNDENVLYYGTYKADILYRMKKYDEALEAIKILDFENFNNIIKNDYDISDDEGLFLDMVTGWYPDYNIYYIRSKIHYQLKNYDDALFFINKDLEYVIDPQLGNSYAFKSEILTKLGRYKEALLAIEKAIEFKPQYFRLYHIKFNMLLTTKNFNDILKLVGEYSVKSQKFKELDDYNIKTWFYDMLIVNLLSLGYNAIAVKLIKELELIDDLDDDGMFIHESWSNFINPIIKFINKTQYSKAIELIKIVEENKHNDSRIDNLKIIAQAGLKNYDEALELVNNAINKKYDLLITYPLTSHSFEDNKKDEYNENDEKLKIEHIYDLLLFKVKILRDMDNIEESISILDKMIDNVPKRDDAYIYKAVFLAVLGRYDNSLEVINELIKQKPEKLEYRLIEIEVLELSKKYKDALLKVNKIIKTNPENINLLNYNVQLNAKLNNLENFEDSSKLLIKKILNSSDHNFNQFECELCGSVFNLSNLDKKEKWPKNCINNNCKANSLNLKIITKPAISSYWQIKFRELDEY